MMSDAFRFRNDGGEEQRRTDGLTGALRCMAEPQMNEGPGNVSVGRSDGRMACHRSERPSPCNRDI